MMMMTTASTIKGYSSLEISASLLFKSKLLNDKSMEGDGMGVDSTKNQCETTWSPTTPPHPPILQSGNSWEK